MLGFELCNNYSLVISVGADCEVVVTQAMIAVYRHSCYTEPTRSVSLIPVQEHPQACDMSWNIVDYLRAVIPQFGTSLPGTLPVDKTGIILKYICWFKYDLDRSTIDMTIDCSHTNLTS